MTDFQLRVLRHTLEGICTANEAALLQHIEHLEALLQDALKEGGHIDVNSTPIGELRAENLQLREENSRLAERVTELETRVHEVRPGYWDYWTTDNGRRVRINDSRITQNTSFVVYSTRGTTETP